jgi:hypothetical protein
VHTVSVPRGPNLSEGACCCPCLTWNFFVYNKEFSLCIMNEERFTFATVSLVYTSSMCPQRPPPLENQELKKKGGSYDFSNPVIGITDGRTIPHEKRLYSWTCLSHKQIRRPYLKFHKKTNMLRIYRMVLWIYSFVEWVGISRHFNTIAVFDFCAELTSACSIVVALSWHVRYFKVASCSMWNSKLDYSIRFRQNDYFFTK